MSYVFSKALQETTEEKQRRKTLPPKWQAHNVPHHKVPPPVANKPKPSTAVTPGISKEAPVQSSAVRQPFRKASLPSRSYSVDSDYGTGPKMGGAFARLQANLDRGEQPAQRSLYSEVYEAYRIKRSLKEHGVLPSELRNNEQLRKYSLDKDSPPIVLPKPYRSSGDNRRDVFGRNRSSTTPTSPTSNFFEESILENDPVFNEAHELKQHKSNGEEFQPVIAEKHPDSVEINDDTAATEHTPSVTPPIEVTPNTNAAPATEADGATVATEAPPDVDVVPVPNDSAPVSELSGEEVKKMEQAPHVIAMREEIAKEKTQIEIGKRSLSDAIDELENVDFDICEPNGIINEEAASQDLRPKSETKAAHGMEVTAVENNQETSVFETTQSTPTAEATTELAARQISTVEPTKETEAAVKPVPEIQVAAEPVPEIQVAAEPVLEIQIVAEPVPEIQAAAEPVPESQVAAEPVPEIQVAVEPVPDIEAAVELVPEIEAAAEPVPEIQVAAEIEAAAEPVPEIHVANEPVPESQAVSDVSKAATEVTPGAHTTPTPQEGAASSEEHTQNSADALPDSIPSVEIEKEAPGSVESAEPMASVESPAVPEISMTTIEKSTVSSLEPETNGISEMIEVTASTSGTNDKLVDQTDQNVNKNTDQKKDLNNYSEMKIRTETPV